MKRTATVLIPLCGIVLALPALAPAHKETFAVKVSVRLKFQQPQRISGKVSSPSPACRSNRRVVIRAADGSAATEFVTDRNGAFQGQPSGGIAARKDYEARVFRSVAPGSHGRRHICAGVVVSLGHQPPKHAR
jgi:hypothetical protein